MKKIEYLATKEELEQELLDIDKLFLPSYIKAKKGTSESWKRYYYALQLLHYRGKFRLQKYPNETVETIIFDGMEFNRPVYYKKGEGPITSREQLLEAIDKVLNKKPKALKNKK